MSLITRNLALIALTFALAACEAPIIFTSGGALDGIEAEPPAVWQFEQASDLAQLETRPEEPYSINLVYVQMDGKLYIYAGPTRTNWVQHIEEDPRVRLLIGDTIYPLRAVRIEDQAELEAFAKLWVEGSFFQRDPLQFDEVWLYQLDARG